MGIHTKALQATLIAVLAVAFFLSLAEAADDQENEDWSNLQTGRDVFLAACVTCHGARGTGSDATLLGFDVEPPDFTNCKFTSRETRSDWVGVAHGGGPIKGFSPMMPAFGKALSRRQIEDVVVYLKDFCPEKNGLQENSICPRRSTPEKLFPKMRRR